MADLDREWPLEGRQTPHLLAASSHQFQRDGQDSRRFSFREATPTRHRPVPNSTMESTQPRSSLAIGLVKMPAPQSREKPENSTPNKLHLTVQRIDCPDQTSFCLRWKHFNLDSRVDLPSTARQNLLTRTKQQHSVSEAIRYSQHIAQALFTGAS